MSDQRSGIDESLRRRFERGWREGHPEAIEAVMVDCAPERAAATLQELLHIELEFRIEAGERCTAAALITRFPDLPKSAGDELQSYELEISQPRTPQRVGPYRIVRVLGAGGMGKVYLAEQASPQRLVALKVLNPLLLSRHVVRRFRQEAQVLGRLQHPGIARIFEANVQEQTPYIVMEFVDGPTLRRWIDVERPSPRDRLQTFIAICDGVTHAHQRGVVHRDLKPSNILIETINGRPVPRILDFGLARLVNEEQRAASMVTGTGQILGTLQYMSPEQTQGDASAIDTGCDVYALGAILHEMLSGRVPYELSGVPVPEALRIIRERDPVRLSSIDSALRGDLETIVATAMEKEPSRRYPSVTAFADDIRAHLEDRPIRAHPPSTVYQLRKFARRNRALVAAGLVIAVTLVVATIISVSEAVAATRALEESERQARIAAAVNEFLTDDLIAAANPYAADREAPDELTVSQVLDTASETVHERFGDAPMIEAAVRLAIGRSYIGLGRFQPAIEQLSTADEMLRQVSGADDPLRLDARFALVRAHFDMGSYQIVEPMLLDVIERRARVLGDDHIDTLEARSGLSWLYWFTRRLEEAETVRRDVLARQRRALGTAHPHTVQSFGALAELLRAGGRHDEAEPLFRHAVEAMREDSGRLPADALAHLQNFSNLYYDQQRYEEAETVKAEIVSTARRVLGDEHPETLKYRASLAEVWRRLGRLDDAESLHAEVLAARRRTIGPRHAWTLSSQERLADVYFDQERFDEAEGLLADTVAVGDEVLPEGFWYRGVFRRKWGRSLAALGRREEAEKVLLAAHRELVDAGARASQRMLAARSLADLYDDWGRPDDAERWKAVAREE